MTVGRFPCPKEIEQTTKQGSPHSSTSQQSVGTQIWARDEKTKPVCLCFVPFQTSHSSVCFHGILGGSCNETAGRKSALTCVSKARTPNKNIHKMGQLIFGLLGCMLALVSWLWSWYLVCSSFLPRWECVCIHMCLGVVFYSIFFYDFGDGDHVFQPVRVEKSQLDSSWMFIFLATDLTGKAMGTETKGCVSDTLAWWGTNPEW